MSLQFISAVFKITSQFNQIFPQQAHQKKFFERKKDLYLFEIIIDFVNISYSKLNMACFLPGDTKVQIKRELEFSETRIEARGRNKLYIFLYLCFCLSLVFIFKKSLFVCLFYLPTFVLYNVGVIATCGSYLNLNQLK